MTMAAELNGSIAVAKQAYDELMGLTTMHDLGAQRFGTGPKRDRVESLLETLNTHVGAIQLALSQQVAESGEAPIISIPVSHRAFYNDVVRPHGTSLQKAFIHICGLGMLAGIFDDRDGGKTRAARLDAMRVGLQRWMDGLGDDELFDLSDRGLNLEGALEILDMPWFEPDQWARNFAQLQPVLLDRRPEVMNEHVRHRLMEIYRAFAFGLWMSAIALSRSLVEFSIKQNAGRLGIEVDFEAEPFP